MVTETFTPGEDFVVPIGVDTITVELEGTKGQVINNSNQQIFESGDGGRVAGDLSVSPGETLYIRSSPGGASDGQNGGDSIDIRRGGTALSDRIAVAAGGGGGGIYGELDEFYPYDDFLGGDGGADTGEDGQYGSDAGEGGTQSSGGAGGTDSSAGNDGEFGSGGDHPGESNDIGAGGGGAGWYGGGAGSSNVTSTGTNESDGGGGGSNYDDGLDTVTANERGTSSRSYSQGGLVTITYEVAPVAPGASAAYVADDQIDVSISEDASAGDPDNFEVEMRRDEGSWQTPAGGPSSTSTAGTYSYGPSSDSGYGEQIGIDSKFEFRVRAVNDAGPSDWTYTDPVRTRPLSPHDPSINRPDGDTLVIEYTDNSDVADKTAVFYRKDSGSGYGSWQYTDAISTGAVSKGAQRSLTVSVGDAAWFERDARYQFRLRHEHVSSGLDSGFVYADYGNEGNVYFADDFESGDLSAWDSTTGVVATGDASHPNAADTGINGPDSGSYFATFDAEGFVEKSLGDLTGETSVLVRCALATGSMDNASEYTEIQWYDGSSWNTVERLDHSYNEQGWVEVHEIIPDSWLSADSRVRVLGVGGLGGGDQHAVDRFVVSDVLHEYTTPATPSNLSLDASTGREITATWSLSASVAAKADVRDTETWFGPTGDSLTGVNRDSGMETYTFTNLLDGERYRVEVNDSIIQHRRGSPGVEIDSERAAGEATTNLPAPTALTVSGVTADSADVLFEDNANNKAGYRAYSGPVSSFEAQGDFDAWTEQKGFQRVDDESYFGDWSAYAQRPSGDSDSQPRASRVYHDGGEQIRAFEFYWRETENSYGGGVRLKNSNGDYELGVATDNPAWVIDDANGQREPATGEGGYSHWVRFLVVFDWSAGTFSVDFESYGPDEATYSESDIPLKQGVDVETVELWNYHVVGGWGDGALEMWWDGISTYTQNGGDLPPQYSLNYTNGYTKADTNISNARGGFSIAVRFALDGTANSKQSLVGAGQHLLQIEDLSSGGSYRAWSHTNGPSESALPSSDFVSGDVHEVVWTYDYGTDTGDFYHDGEKIKTYTENHLDDIEQIGTVETGSWSDGERRLQGKIDTVRIYDRKLSDAEALDVLGASPPTAGLLIKYDYDGGPSNTSLEDKSPNGWDGDFANSPEWAPPLSRVKKTLSDLKNGEAYVTRASIFTDDTEVFDE
ncbi:hypothetical protein C464_06180 [Halorubrum coriense DSM 10284]|uniref:Fibronectin type-III domain-containing protein n=1 Tax=Halorubrum coriense DSM 10284 TaxID=1227466 RepID=M0EMI2_9EURY|nr:LamG-like jellyroll fold domain-containing protein [Halorubrum coriense]ELZ48976.1 hypothetical protein C464_06180 [Halorubrum coriense DSM 10284]QRG24131.1 hypothetical protein HrrHm1_100 [Halorubrum virus Humcor1]